MSIITILPDATVSQDPELKTFGSGTCVLNIKTRVLNGEKKPEGEQYAPSEWVTVEVWGKLAQTLEPLIHKHTAENPCRLFVAGNLVTRTYQAGDGTQKTELIVKNPSQIQLLDRKYNNDTSSVQQPSQQVAPVVSSNTEEDIPF